MTSELEKKCDIRAETKLRNGYPNWWCYTHFSSARGEGGIKLDRCEKSYDPPIQEDEKIKINLADYPGGVGIWGALEAVLDTKRDISDKGVHVHLRRNEGEAKIVDRSFKEVYLKVAAGSLHDDEWIKIDDYTACAYTASVVFNRNLKIIKCKHCGQHHIDADWFAVHYHKKHFCTFCGRDFIDTERGISNPVFYLQNVFKEQLKDRKLILANRRLEIQQKDYPGGIQIWGSNPAIIWTAKRAEEEGIHVHLFDGHSNEPVSDETYGYVAVDGIELDEKMIRYYMVQRSFPYLKKYIDSLNCPECKKEHFDLDDKALNPHKVHECEHCGCVFEDKSRYKTGVVSNPVVKKLNKIEDNHKVLFSE